jgi:thiamine biosynthesis lipoprotein
MNHIKKSYSKSVVYMDTVVTIKIATSLPEVEVNEGFTRAFAAFNHVQKVCNRFDPKSEISRLSQHIGVAVPVSPLLFETLRFALEVAISTDGVFDPTIGHTLEEFGFNRNYLSHTILKTPYSTAINATYEDIVLDEKNHTVILQKPLLLDLGAVAKGLAVDLAAKDLFSVFEGFAIDAGGDIYAKGLNENNTPWGIGIRHPVEQDKIICSLKLCDAAICTSGSYERRSPMDENSHHLIDPRTKLSSNEVLSCSVIAPFAMMADAFSTATFILGVEKGIAKLEENGLEGLMITSALDISLTKEMSRLL